MDDLPASSPIKFDNLTPTLFMDFDGTLHRGRGLIDEVTGKVSLGTGNPVFEFAPLLANLLEPYPAVEIVLTTSWLHTLSFEQVTSDLPAPLATRVVGSTRGYKARFGYLQDGSARTYIIRSYVFDKRLKNWLALDDSVYGVRHSSTDFLPLEPHLVLLDAQQGIASPEAQDGISQWLRKVHVPGKE
ncbi:HAD domain-containing protein [Burkholderia pseudomallei]|uniref:HAD domain-containing protein n=1 Tax=Burkholderia pseudomallei TaxID=28450 RepID=UPI0005722319|nr:HAD domain-containing protein [Burkholderia pseudomallei]